MNSNAAQKRAANWSTAELETLQEATTERKSYLESPANTVKANFRKKRGWQQIADIVNAVGGQGRSGENCRKRWSDFKSQLKNKVASIRKEQAKTGGGPSQAPQLSSLEEKAAQSIRKQAVEGVPRGVDTLQLPKSNSAASSSAAKYIDIASAPADEFSEAVGRSASPEYETADDEKSEESVANPAAKNTKRQRKQSKLGLIESLEIKRLRVEEARLEVENDRLFVERERLKIETERLRVEQERLTIEKKNRGNESSQQLNFNDM